MSSRPACVYQPACPGCPRFNESGLDPDQTDRLLKLSERYGGPAVSFHSSSGHGYRHRVRLSVRGRVGDCRIGIFEAGSHRLVAIPQCPVHHPAIRELLVRLPDVLNRERVTPYDEGEHKGRLRGVQMAVEPTSGQVQVVLLVNDDLNDVRPALAELAGTLQFLRTHPRVQGVFLGALPHRGNSLFFVRYHRCFGAKVVEDLVGGVRVFFPPHAFGQANPVLHARAVEQIHQLVPQDASVVEYYAGVGTIGLGLLARGNRVQFNELGPGSLEGLRLGLSDLGRAPGAAQVHEGRAGDFSHLYEADDTVIVDPPRKGLDPALLGRLGEAPPRRLVYLSCGLDALLRELDVLLSPGKHVIEHLSAWGYFPYTAHVETLASLRRA